MNNKYDNMNILVRIFYWEPELCNVVMFFTGFLLDIWHNTKTDPLRHYNEKQEKCQYLIQF